ncbi:MAG: hypothetical protein J5636_04460 [Clostridiales bacterium]|nr:hypothetical protein [Clostridiales bacterium]
MAQFFNKIDAKGRIFIPSKAKEGMGEVMHVMISRDRNFLCVYNEARFQKICDQFDDDEDMDHDKRLALRAFVGSSQECEMDSQGRICINSTLWNWIGAKPQSEVCIYQYRDKLEICTKEYSDAEQAMIANMNFEALNHVKGL